MASNDATAQFEGGYTGETNPVVGTNNGDDHHGIDNGGGNVGVTLKKGPWTADEDAILIEYVVNHGEGNWNAVRKSTGLPRCGKSCRLRWVNHLRPNLKKGAFSPEEEQLIVQLHAQFGNKWAKMASLLPGRTDNEIKNYWNTRIKRRQCQGLPLYSNEPQQRYTTPPTTPPSLRSPSSLTAPTTPTGPTFLFHTQHRHFPLSPSTPTSLTAPITPTTPTGPSPKFQFHAQHHHFPLSPTSHPHSPLTPQHPTTPTYNFNSPSSTFTSSGFTFQRPTPLLSPTLRFKRFRSSNGSYSLPPSTTSSTCAVSQLNHQPATNLMPSIGGFQFPTSSLEMIKTQVDSSDHVVISPTSVHRPSNLELPSNQFSKYRQPDQITFDTNTNVNENTTAQMNHREIMGSLSSQSYVLTSGENSGKQSLFDFKDDESSLFDECRDLDEFSSLFWPNSTSEMKTKEETSDFSKAMQDDLSKLLTGIPSSIQISDWFSDWEGSNGQSSVLTSDVTIGGDLRPSKSMASLVPDASQGNHNHHDNTSASCLHLE